MHRRQETSSISSHLPITLAQQSCFITSTLTFRFYPSSLTLLRLPEGMKLIPKLRDTSPQTHSHLVCFSCGNGHFSVKPHHYHQTFNNDLLEITQLLLCNTISQCMSWENLLINVFGVHRRASWVSERYCRLVRQIMGRSLACAAVSTGFQIQYLQAWLLHYKFPP